MDHTVFEEPFMNRFVEKSEEDAFGEVSIPGISKGDKKASNYIQKFIQKENKDINIKEEFQFPRLKYSPYHQFLNVQRK